MALREPYEREYADRQRVVDYRKQHYPRPKKPAPVYDKAAYIRKLEEDGMLGAICMSHGCREFRHLHEIPYCGECFRRRQKCPPDAPELGKLIPLIGFGKCELGFIQYGWLWCVMPEQVMLRFAVCNRKAHTYDLQPMHRDPYKRYRRDNGMPAYPTQKEAGSYGGFRLWDDTLEALNRMYPDRKIYYPTEERMDLIGKVCPIRRSR